jgi:hypothetical protein
MSFSNVGTENPSTTATPGVEVDQPNAYRLGKGKENLMADNQQTPGRGWHRFARRPSSASLVSIVAHVIIGVLILNAIKMPAVFDQFLQVDRPAKTVAERVEYVPSATRARNSFGEGPRRAALLPRRGQCTDGRRPIGRATRDSRRDTGAGGASDTTLRGGVGVRCVAGTARRAVSSPMIRASG